jgi:hypothetical protein
VAVNAHLDHLVVGASSLESGAASLERFLGVPLSPGGRHARMGTHNRLLRLGADSYLEVIAIDPDGPGPERPRWFGLDEPESQALDDGPRLLHWVAQVESTATAPPEVDLGPWEAFQRGSLSWRLTVSADGRLPLEGVVPSLIVWDGADHPSRHLAEAGCVLHSLRLVHPGADEVNRFLTALGLPFQCGAGPTAEIIAEVRTPGGVRVLRSTEAIPG